MISYTIATTCKHGEVFHHLTLKNADGTPMRCRVNGKCKTWKRDLGDPVNMRAFRLPVKRGLRECFYITLINAHDWQSVTAAA